MIRSMLVLTLVLAFLPCAFAKKSGNRRTAARWEPDDVRILREYYGQHPVNLPPGLQKKYARTGQLPPGWQKKMQAFPSAIETRLPPPCAYCGRGIVDGYGVIYDKRTRIILDSVRLAGEIFR